MLANVLGCGLLVEKLKENAVVFNFSKQNFALSYSHIIVSHSPHSGHASF